MRPKRAFKNGVVLQSGGPTAVINRSLEGAVMAWEERGCGTLFGAKFGAKGLLENRLIQLYPHEQFAQISSVGQSPSAALGSARYSLRDKKWLIKELDLEKIFKNLEARQIGYIFLIGGEDSRDNAFTLWQYAQMKKIDVCVIHIPKTIDNDLTFTHHSPGYPSAAQFVVNALAGIDRDNEAISGVTMNIIMGRKTGWLTASAYLARKAVVSVYHNCENYLQKSYAEKTAGPHLIYVPEVPFSIDRFLGDISNTLQKYGRVNAVMAEGIGEHSSIIEYIKNCSGSAFFSELCEIDGHGHPQLGGNGVLGSVLCHIVKNGLKIKRVRANSLDQLQRSFPMVSQADSQEAYNVAVYGVRRALEGVNCAGVVIGNNDCACSERISHFNLADAFKEGQPRIKTLPSDFIRGTNDIAEIFEDYMGMHTRNDPLVEIPRFSVFDLD